MFVNSINVSIAAYLVCLRTWVMKIILIQGGS